MDELTDVARAVLQAAHELQHGDPDASVDAAAVYARAGELLPPARATTGAVVRDADGGPHRAELDDALDALENSGHIEVDVGLADAADPARGAALVEDDRGVRVTDLGRAALNGV